MARISIPNENIIRFTVSQGTEYERSNSSEAAFLSGELAFTRDTQRLFVGNYTPKDDVTSTVGGVLAGNKLLDTVSKDKSLATVTEVLNGGSDLDTTSPFTVNWNFSTQSAYNEDLKAYDGDYLYVPSNHAYVFFNKNENTGNGYDIIYAFEPDKETIHFKETADGTNVLEVVGIKGTEKFGKLFDKNFVLEKTGDDGKITLNSTIFVDKISSVGDSLTLPKDITFAVTENSGISLQFTDTQHDNGFTHILGLHKNVNEDFYTVSTYQVLTDGNVSFKSGNLTLSNNLVNIDSISSKDSYSYLTIPSLIQHNGSVKISYSNFANGITSTGGNYVAIYSNTSESNTFASKLYSYNQDFVVEDETQKISLSPNLENVTSIGSENATISLEGTVDKISFTENAILDSTNGTTYGLGITLDGDNKYSLVKYTQTSSGGSGGTNLTGSTDIDVSEGTVSLKQNISTVKEISYYNTDNPFTLPSVISFKDPSYGSSIIKFSNSPILSPTHKPVAIKDESTGTYTMTFVENDGSSGVGGSTGLRGKDPFTGNTSSYVYSGTGCFNTEGILLKTEEWDNTTMSSEKNMLIMSKYWNSKNVSTNFLKEPVCIMWNSINHYDKLNSGDNYPSNILLRFTTKPYLYCAEKINDNHNIRKQGSTILDKDKTEVDLYENTAKWIEKYLTYDTQRLAWDRMATVLGKNSWKNITEKEGQYSIPDIKETQKYKDAYEQLKNGTDSIENNTAYSDGEKETLMQPYYSTYDYGVQEALDKAIEDAAASKSYLAVFKPAENLYIPYKYEPSDKGYYYEYTIPIDEKDDIAFPTEYVENDYDNFSWYVEKNAGSFNIQYPSTKPKLWEVIENVTPYPTLNLLKDDIYYGTKDYEQVGVLFHCVSGSSHKKVFKQISDLQSQTISMLGNVLTTNDGSYSISTTTGIAVEDGKKGAVTYAKWEKPTSRIEGITIVGKQNEIVLKASNPTSKPYTTSLEHYSIVPITVETTQFLESYSEYTFPTDGEPQTLKPVPHLTYYLCKLAKGETETSFSEKALYYQYQENCEEYKLGDTQSEFMGMTPTTSYYSEYACGFKTSDQQWKSVKVTVDKETYTMYCQYEQEESETGTQYRLMPESLIIPITKVIRFNANNLYGDLKNYLEGNPDHNPNIDTSARINVWVNWEDGTILDEKNSTSICTCDECGCQCVGHILVARETSSGYEYKFFEKNQISFNRVVRSYKKKITTTNSEGETEQQEIYVNEEELDKGFVYFNSTKNPFTAASEEVSEKYDFYMKLVFNALDVNRYNYDKNESAGKIRVESQFNSFPYVMSTTEPQQDVENALVHCASQITSTATDNWKIRTQTWGVNDFATRYFVTQKEEENLEAQKEEPHKVKNVTVAIKKQGTVDESIPTEERVYIPRHARTILLQVQVESLLADNSNSTAISIFTANSFSALKKPYGKPSEWVVKVMSRDIGPTVLSYHRKLKFYNMEHKSLVMFKQETEPPHVKGKEDYFYPRPTHFRGHITDTNEFKEVEERKYIMLPNENEILIGYIKDGAAFESLNIIEVPINDDGTFNLRIASRYAQSNVQVWVVGYKL